MNWRDYRINNKQLKEKEYKCNLCNRSFCQGEYNLTGIKNKCILHKNENFKLKYSNFKYYINALNEYLKKNSVNSNKCINFYDIIFYEANFISYKDIFTNLKLANLDAIYFINCDFYIKNLRGFPESKNRIINPILPKESKSIFYNKWEEKSCVSYHNCIFKKDLTIKSSIVNNENFYGQFYKCNFEKNILFQEVNICRKVFELTDFHKKSELRILDCIVNEDFILKIKEGNLLNLNLEKTIFNRKVKIIDFKINNANFKRTKFNGLTGFEKTEFKIVDFRNTRFNDIVRFIGTKFKNNVSFEHTYFYKKAIFNEIEIESKINLDKTIFFDSTSFYKIKYSNDCILNRETARIIKNSFEQQNNIIEANKFYALEMQEQDKELTWGKDFFEKLIFSIHGWSSNHSQDWLLALFWILNISFITSMFSCTIEDTMSSLKYLDRTLSIFLTVGVLGVILFKSMKYIGKWSLLLCSSFVYFIYGKVAGSYSLDSIVNKINPFSVMNSWDDISFNEFIFKIVIAYLIYQLIISIRQNTRRK